jgi:RNA polymerase sigma-70 factor (ECF subfamily)
MREWGLVLPTTDQGSTSGASPTEEEALVAAAREGDRGAFAELYARYGRMVHGVLLARVRWTDAEDLVQDVFLIALRRLTSLRDSAAFGGWLAAIARHRAIDHLRRRREVQPPEDSDAAVDEEPQRRALAILEMIQSLPEAYRETLALRLVEGMTGPEIAARTGLTPASVRVNLHRGMKHLRARLGGTEVA